MAVFGSKPDNFGLLSVSKLVTLSSTKLLIAIMFKVFKSITGDTSSFVVERVNSRPKDF